MEESKKEKPKKELKITESNLREAEKYGLEITIKPLVGQFNYFTTEATPATAIKQWTKDGTIHREKLLWSEVQVVFPILENEVVEEGHGNTAQ